MRWWLILPFVTNVGVTIDAEMSFMHAFYFFSPHTRGYANIDVKYISFFMGFPLKLLVFHRFFANGSLFTQGSTICPGQIGAAMLFACCGVMELFVWKQVERDAGSCPSLPLGPRILAGDLP